MREILWYNGRETVLRDLRDSEYSLRPAAAEDLTFALRFGTGADANIICILITLPLAQMGAVRKWEWVSLWEWLSFRNEGKRKGTFAPFQFLSYLIIFGWKRIFPCSTNWIKSKTITAWTFINACITTTTTLFAWNTNLQRVSCLVVFFIIHCHANLLAS